MTSSTASAQRRVQRPPQARQRVGCGAGAKATPPRYGPPCCLRLRLPVTASVALVRPWNPVSSAMNSLRPVKARASRMAPSTASAPLLQKNVFSSRPGVTSASRCASAPTTGTWYRYVPQWMNRSICSRAASTTRGWEWPVLTTEMPAKQSR